MGKMPYFLWVERVQRCEQTAKIELNLGRRRSADFRTVRCNRTESLALSHSGIPASGYLAGSLAGHFFHGDGNDAGLNGVTKGSRRFWGRCCELETGG